jgi:hypothetical protein
LVVIAGLVGFAAALVIWYITSRFIVSSIFWVEQRYPQIIGTRMIRVSEMVVCGLQVLATFALAFWIARWMIA